MNEEERKKEDKRKKKEERKYVLTMASYACKCDHL